MTSTTDPEAADRTAVLHKGERNSSGNRGTHILPSSEALWKHTELETVWQGFVHSVRRDHHEANASFSKGLAKEAQHVSGFLSAGSMSSLGTLLLCSMETTMRLEAGQQAPGFSVIDLEERAVSLEGLLGRPVLLSFFRYGSCPLCNLRIAFLIGAYPRLHEMGLEIVAVFESPADTLRQTVGKQPTPFSVVPDPDRTLYKRYGVTASLLGYVRGGFRISAFREARKKGFRFGKIDGAATQLPAEFLIGEDGVIELAYYGADIGDHLPIDEIADWLSEET